jgi:organic radical activating enzyme
MMLKISSIEVTNICNLRCPHCPVGVKPFRQNILPILTDGVDYPKGYMSMARFKQALQYTGSTVKLHLHGEPLLHPQICDFVCLVRQQNKRVVVSTNGILLTEAMSQKLIESGTSQIEVSIHTQKSLQGFKNLFDANEKAGRHSNIFGHLVDCNILKLRKWVNRTKIERKYLHRVFLFATHNWALNAPTLDLYERCSYVNNGLCDVKWDGRIVACCFDFEGKNYLGELDDFSNLQHKKYELCKCCSPTWVQGYDNFYFAPVLDNEHLWPEKPFSSMPIFPKIKNKQ